MVSLFPFDNSNNRFCRKLSLAILFLTNFTLELWKDCDYSKHLHNQLWFLRLEFPLKKPGIKYLKHLNAFRSPSSDLEKKSRTVFNWVFATSPFLIAFFRLFRHWWLLFSPINYPSWRNALAKDDKTRAFFCYGFISLCFWSKQMGSQASRGWICQLKWEMNIIEWMKEANRRTTRTNNRIITNWNFTTHYIGKLFRIWAKKILMKLNSLFVLSWRFFCASISGS